MATHPGIRRKIFYRQPYYNKQLGGYYIHFHGRDIGKIQKWRNAGDPAEEFIAQKDKIKMAVNRQYINLLKNNITPEGLNLINGLLESEYSNTFLTELDKVIKKELQSQVNMGVLQAIHRRGDRLLERDVSFEALGIERAVGELNKLLEYIQIILNQSKNSENAKDLTLKIYMGAVTRSAQGGTPTLTDVGKAFKAQINKLNKLSQKGYWITPQQQNSLIDYLNMVYAYFDESNNKKKLNELTYKTLRNIFQQNISPKGIGEVFGLKIDQKANLVADKTVEEAVKEIDNTLRFSGDAKGKLYFSDANGNYNQKASNRITQGLSQDTIYNGTIKTDMREFLTVKMKDIDKELSGEFDIDVGVSSKFYFNHNMFDVDTNTKPSGNFEVSSVLPLSSAIKSTFSTQRLQYLAYNVFAWQDDSETGNLARRAIQSLQECIFKRNFIHAASSRSGVGPTKDFAGYFLINGKVLTLWEILDYIFEGSPTSWVSENKSSEEKGVSFQYSKKAITNFITQRFNKTMRERIAGVDRAILDTRIKVGINPAKIIKA